MRLEIKIKSVGLAILGCAAITLASYLFGDMRAEKAKRDEIVNVLLEDRRNIVYDAKLFRTSAEQDSALKEADHISSVLKRLYQEGQLEGISERQFHQIFPDSAGKYPRM